MNAIETLAREVVDSAFCVHRELGPGLLESAYEACLGHELKTRGIKIDTQVSRPVRYRSLSIDAGYRLDILVENQIILELKAVEKLLPIHKAQLLTYLKLNKNTLGFLINFNSPLIKDGIKRVVLNHSSQA
ncbi:GxxExxY protein [Roseibacillus ishigakijimensis]|uniref:GxxExxY protein n=1 Tax=Roseibacillus ishigakijimensis TaxID=454146 RepID=A0A934RQG9_9BACT|nr:GxxExxY protein [Roseibacillus ishigakijimensis]MBK1832656.1 GxxExxY protein [Roseibacillus ishigakijimensis]